jgi:uncharacterized membrane protein
MAEQLTNEFYQMLALICIAAAVVIVAVIAGLLWAVCNGKGFPTRRWDEYGVKPLHTDRPKPPKQKEPDDE